jgi:Family of unknown function (DUF6491)
MKRLAQILSLAVLTGFAFSGCASTPSMREAERLTLYRNYAGEPVNGFQYFGHFSRWTPLGDSAIAIWVGPTRAWLLDLYGPCSDLEFAHSIRLSSNSGRVSARFDSVQVVQRGLMTMPCRIKEIRPLDVKALRTAEKASRHGPQAKPAEDRVQPSGT